MSAEYTGHVDPGGVAIRRTVRTGAAEVEVCKLSVGPMDNNAYILTDLATERSLLIDAADEPDRLLSEIGSRQLAHILTTHGHGDHWQGLTLLADVTRAATWLHPDDNDLVPFRADHAITDGDQITFGDASVTLIHTPGHTPGSTCALLGDRHLFSGDTLFPGGPGKTSDSEHFSQIMDSVESRIFGVLTDDTWVYPGHGDDSTLGTERPHLREWRERGW